MADARSLLRAARAERRINHPHAQYSSSGRLACSICESTVKDDKNAWNSHLHSTYHIERSSRARQTVPNSKKRKAENVEVEDADDRKRARSAIHDNDDARDSAGDETLTGIGAEQSNATSPPVSEATDANDAVDAEYVALLNEMEAIETEERVDPHTAVRGPATVSAAPKPAEPTLTEKDKTSARLGIDGEAETENQDAAHRLEYELGEMRAYEDRVQILKDRRETLRKSMAIAHADADADNSKDGPAKGHFAIEPEDDTSDEEYEEWGFGPV